MEPIETQAALVVRAQGVVKRYGAKVALDGLDVEIGHGVTGLLGANGAGKTTLISLMLGLRRRDEGAMSVLGHDPQTAGIDVRERIGYGPEHHNLPPEVQAQDLVRHLTELHGIPPRAAIQRASDALWQVGLGEERLRPVGTMSTGQRQRVKLASAIAHDPALVLLDEPTGDLDTATGREILGLLQKLNKEEKVTLLVATHDAAVAAISSRVVKLRDGKIESDAANPA